MKTISLVLQSPKKSNEKGEKFDFEGVSEFAVLSQILMFLGISRPCQDSAFPDTSARKKKKF